MKALSSTALTAITWSLTALDTFLTAGRLLMHWQKLKKFRVDDVFNGIALICLFGFMITWQQYIIAEYETQLYAAGMRETPPSHYDPIEARKYDSANILLYWCTMYAVKASFLALYWQIFEVSRRLRIAWIALSVYIGLSFAISILSFFWHCGSPANLINLSACRHWLPRAFTIAYMTASLHIIGDILMMMLPITMLKPLKMRKSEKLGLALIFALVLIDVAFTILRVVLTRIAYNSVPDRNVLWSTLDPIVAVMVCTLPCYRHVLSIDRKRPITRTPYVSFDSSKFTNMFQFTDESSRTDNTMNIHMGESSVERIDPEKR